MMAACYMLAGQCYYTLQCNSYSWAMLQRLSYSIFFLMRCKIITMSDLPRKWQAM